MASRRTQTNLRLPLDTREGLEAIAAVYGAQEGRPGSVSLARTVGALVTREQHRLGLLADPVDRDPVDLADDNHHGHADG